MIINKDTHLLNIQLGFSEKFPHLKLEFFNNSHQKNELSSLSTEIMKDLTLSQINPDFDSEKVLVLYNDEKVFDFEERMQKEFGLFVQVYRKSNNIWLQTSATDDWTLNKQEEIATQS